MVGDGRCLFRAVVHGSCLRSGQPPPGEALQRQMADELRIKVRDDSRPSHPDVQALLLRSSQPRSPGLQPIFAELMSPACYYGPHRFLEGDFDAYVRNIRRPHAWGGEPELLMLSHILRCPFPIPTSSSLKATHEDLCPSLPFVSTLDC
eukprot:SM000217S06857  [mRNA]  locus=s217:224855:226062:+ [translate_table: standard]